MTGTFQLKNNFESFRHDFKAQTKLDPDKHMAEYIAYANFRMVDMNYQLTNQLGNALLNKLDQLKGR